MLYNDYDAYISINAFTITIYNVTWAQNDVFTNHISRLLSIKFGDKKWKALRAIGHEFHHFNHFTLYLPSTLVFAIFAISPRSFWFRIRILISIYMKKMKKILNIKYIILQKYYKNKTNNVKTYLFHKINVICGIHNNNEFIKILWPVCFHCFVHRNCYSLQFRCEDLWINKVLSMYSWHASSDAALILTWKKYWKN